MKYYIKTFFSKDFIEVPKENFDHWCEHMREHSSCSSNKTEEFIKAHTKVEDDYNADNE